MIQVKRDKRDWCSRDGRLGFNGVEYSLPLMEADELKILDLEIQQDKSLLEEMVQRKDLDGETIKEARGMVNLRRRQASAIIMDFLRRKKNARPLESFAFQAVYDCYGGDALTVIKEKAKELQAEHQATVHEAPKRAKRFVPHIEWVEEKMCGGKVRHASQPSANEQLESMKASGKSVKRMNIYECPFCGYFHIGHKPKEGTWVR